MLCLKHWVSNNSPGHYIPWWAVTVCPFRTKHLNGCLDISFVFYICKTWRTMSFLKIIIHSCKGGWILLVREDDCSVTCAWRFRTLFSVRRSNTFSCRPGFSKSPSGLSKRRINREIFIRGEDSAVFECRTEVFFLLLYEFKAFFVLEKKTWQEDQAHMITVHCVCPLLLVSYWQCWFSWGPAQYETQYYAKDG